MHRILPALLLSTALLLQVAWARVPAGATGAHEPPLAVSPISSIRIDADGDSVPDAKGRYARVRGVVTIPPDAFGNRNFHAVIQDASGGLSLFHWDLQMTLAPGDIVEATGKIQQYRGAVQLAGGEVRIIDKGAVPDARPVSIAEVAGGSHMGRRVQVEGVTGNLSLDSSGILQLSGDGGHSIALYIPAPATGEFDWERYAQGTRISATGVVSIFKESWPYDSNFQLIVTSPEDLSVLEAPPAAWEAWLPWALIALGTLLAAMVAVFYLLQSRHRARQRELATLAVLSTAMAAPDLSEEQLARRTCETLTEYGIVEVAMVQVFHERGLLRQLASSSAPGRRSTAPDFAEPLPTGGTTESQKRQIEARVAQSGLKLLALQPLATPSDSHGFLVALSPRTRRASAMQERTLLAAVKLLAMALENCRVRRAGRVERDQLQQLVVTDELTRLYNRRFLNEYLRVQIPLAQRRGSGLAFVTIDIDAFKLINDTWGHEVGDRMLVGVAGVICDVSRSSDLTVRLGGEEFLVVIAGKDLGTAHAFAERLRSTIESACFDHIVEGQSLRVTVSIGVSVFGIHGTTAASLLGASDQAMFLSKRNGRNQVTLASADAGAAQPSPSMG